MAFVEMSAPWRDRHLFVKWLKKLQIHTAPAPPFPKGISNHLARDIGLSAADLERLRFEYPSDGPNRPLI